MARDIADIQRDIERTRNQLASTLDQLAERGKPANLADNAKTQAQRKLGDPQVQKVAAAVGAAVAGLVLIAVLRSRKKNKDINELRRLLAARD